MSAAIAGFVGIGYTWGCATSVIFGWLLIRVLASVWVRVRVGGVSVSVRGRASVRMSVSVTLRRIIHRYSRLVVCINPTVEWPIHEIHTPGYVDGHRIASREFAEER